MLNVKEFYKDKVILISGCTGYLGKIILEKILRTCSDFKTVYVLIRQKKGTTVSKRLHQDIFNSPLFENLFHLRRDLVQVVKERVVAIEGDLVMNDLGIRAEDRQTLIKEVNIIINSAASIAFDDPLMSMIQIDYIGPTRILKFAKECENLIVLSHISTAYVNSNQPDQSEIEEKIYTYPSTQIDFEDHIKNIMATNLDEIQKNEKKYIHNFNNNYLFCKDSAERYLQRYRGDIRLVINRPSIIINCAREPIVGWCDSIAAAGASAFPAGMGIQQNYHVPTFVDFIPADIVSNSILVSTAYAAITPTPEFNIFHNTSSWANKLVTKKFMSNVNEYLKFNIFAKAVQPARLTVYHSNKLAQFHYFIEEELPLRAAILVSQLPVIGSKKLNSDLLKLQKVKQMAQKVLGVLKLFRYCSWYFSIAKFQKVIAIMSLQDQIDFFCDIRKIDMAEEGKNFINGIQRYYLNEDSNPADSGYNQLVQKLQLDWFQDSKFAAFASNLHKEQLLSEVFSQVVNYDNYVRYQTLFTKSPTFNANSIKKQLTRIDCKISPRALRISSYVVNKLLRRSFEGIFVNTQGIKRVKDLLQAQHKIILLPMFKSFVDPLVIYYSLVDQGIKIPFCFGSEEVPNIPILRFALAKLGLIQSSRQNEQNAEQDYVNQALLNALLNKHQFLAIFVNNYRIRSGKLSKPIFPDMAFNWLLQSYITNIQQSGKSVQLVPVVISHERLFDIRHLATEMVSGNKKEHSTVEFINMIKQESDAKLGKVFINYLEPIDLRQYITKDLGSLITVGDVDRIGLQLSRYIRHLDQKFSPINLNMVVATLLLQADFVSVSVDDLVFNCAKIWKYLRASGSNTMITLEPNQTAVINIVKKLGFKIGEQKAVIEGKKSKKIVLLSPKSDRKTLLSLNYYSNQMLQQIAVVCMISRIIYREVKNEKQSVHIQILKQKIMNLHPILNLEFQIRENTSNVETVIQQNLKLLQEFGEVKVNNGLVSWMNQRNQFSFIKTFGKMCSYLVEAYQMVVMAVQEINSANLVIEKNNFVNQLHQAILSMFNDNLVRELMSCLEVVVTSAISSYSVMGLIQIKSYKSQDGVTTRFLFSEWQKRAEIEKVYQDLQDVNQIHEDLEKSWADSISKAVERSKKTQKDIEHQAKL